MPFFSTSSSLHERALLQGLLSLALALPMLALGQSSPSDSNNGAAGIHAGWQMGPVALHTERHRSYGTHNLGNTGYGQALTVQTVWNGPWEIEMKAGRSAVIMDDGAMRGWKTEVQSGSVMVNWVWQAAGNRQDAHTRSVSVGKGFQPFVGIGIAHVDHWMKQDLEDAEGRRYHLWSDGTLRDRDEAGDHAGNATVLRRDYTYESNMSDLQDQSASGRSLAIPAQIGVRLDVSPRVRARMGIGGWLGLTDAVDDQVSGRTFSGDALASGFFGLGIRLGKLSPKPKAPPAGSYYSRRDAALLAAMDTDADGISNLLDRCPGTERGVEVNGHGCPIDSDGDGYADYKDDEPNSPHIRVNARGVAIGSSADDVTTDKSGWDVISGTVTSDDRTNYTLNIPTPEQGWTTAEQQTLLAFKHLTESSEGVSVDVGVDPLAADLAAQTVREAGLEAELVAPETVAAVASDTPALKTSVVNGETPHYRVQLGAYNTPDPAALSTTFEGIDVVRLKGEDGMLRVFSRSFEQRQDADQYKTQLTEMGFTGAFVTGSSVVEEGPETGNEPAPGTAATAQPQFDERMISFRIQLGAMKTEVSVEAMDDLLEIGNVEHRSTTGWHRYLHGNFASASAARAALPALKSAGFEDAFIVGDVSGRIVPLAEAEILLRQD